MKTLFLQPPSFDGFDGGAGSRYQAKREIKSFWFPTWLDQPAALETPHGAGLPNDSGRPTSRPRSSGGDHRLGLLGPGSDVHQEDGLGAGDRFGHACGVVEITGGKLDTRRQAGRPEGSRTNARTLWPCSCSCRATAPPTWPVAPVTRYIFSPFQIGGDYLAPRWTGPRA